MILRHQKEEDAQHTDVTITNTMKLLVGLGNPGTPYTYTKHNVGFRALEACAPDASWSMHKRSDSMIARVVLHDQDMLCAQPQTFMNESGKAVQALLSFYDISVADVCVVYDDIDQLIGSVRIRPDGSAGGHNGMDSIITQLGTKDIARIKIGIAEETRGKQTIPSEQYVLQPFTTEAEEKMKTILTEVPTVVEAWLSGNTTATFSFE